MQSVVPHVDQGGGRIALGVNYLGWDGQELTKPTSNRSRAVLSISARSELSAPHWATRPIPRAGPPKDKDYDLYQQLLGDTAYPDKDAAWQAGYLDGPAWSGRFFPQEVGAAAFVATSAAGTVNAKCEGLVVSAREEPTYTDAEGIVRTAHPSKGVAIQAITVRATKGPDPDDRNQWGEADDDNPDIPDGTNNGAFTLRLNGGTTNQAASYFRSWAAILGGGRAGYLNGTCYGKVHHFSDAQVADGVTQDGDGVLGWGGIWGGRSFWHQDTFAVYAKYSCPGWVTIGHDGITTDEDDIATGVALAPIDIKVDPLDAAIAFNGMGNPKAILTFNGDRLLSVRQAAIANATSGTTVDTINAILLTLRKHGLIADS
jgi:hypothetical protein